MRLGRAIRMLRSADNVNIRQTADTIGISPATLSRVERGLGCSMPTFAFILKWLLEDDEQKALVMGAPAQPMGNEEEIERA